MKEKCDKNCATCSMDNRSYCAIQISIANQEMLMQLHENLSVLTGKSASIIQPTISNDGIEEEN